MRVKILIVCLCVFSFNAMAQKVTSTTLEDEKKNLPPNEYNELNKQVKGRYSFTSLYQDGSNENVLRESSTHIETLFMEGYFSSDVIKNNPKLLKEAADYTVMVINLSKVSKIHSVVFDLSIFKKLKYIVLSSFKSSDVLQVQNEFIKLNQGKGQEIFVVSNIMEQNR